MEWIDKIEPVIIVISEIFLSLSIIATAVSRLIKGKKDDEKVDGITDKIQKAVSWLPTIGINPHTQDLEKRLMEMKSPSKEDN